MELFSEDVLSGNKMHLPGIVARVVVAVAAVVAVVAGVAVVAAAVR